jgi:caffeoyl-CoA O-methyltransferase
MSNTSINLTPMLYEYYQRESTREPDLLKLLRAETERQFGSTMQISPEQGQLMQWLIKLTKAKRTLDIGTFTGYSALAVALALPKDSQVIACDLNSQWTDLAKQFWQEAGVANKISLKLAPAADTLQQLLEKGEANQFDFAFIDADKVNYPTYYELCLRLIKAGGIIAIDNVLWGGAVADKSICDEDTETIRKLNSFIHKDNRVDMTMLPIGDGLTLVRKREI